MSETLADRAESYVSLLGPPLLSEEEVAGFLALAAELPPVTLVGFERSLVGCGRGVDLALHLPRAEPGLAALAGTHATFGLSSHLREMPAWRATERLLRMVGRDLTSAPFPVDDAWLEFGPLRAAGAALAPRLFLGLARPIESATAIVSRASGATPTGAEDLPTVVRGLNGRLPLEASAAVGRVVAALPPGCSVVQVGLRPESPEAGVRLCLAGVAGDRVSDLLRSIEWPGPLPFVDHAVGILAGRVDFLLIDLDLRPNLAPTLGIEGHFHGPRRPRVDVRWEHLLDQLTSIGLGEPEVTAALVHTWCGTTVHTDQASGLTSGEADLQALLRGHAMPCTIRGLSHVKLRLDAAGEVDARVYFGAVRRWVAPSAAGPSVPRPVSSGARRGRPAVEVGRTTAALDFLARAQQPDGWWEDFALAAGSSDSWVTAYVGWCLTLVPDERAVEMVLGAWALLKGRDGADGGWGYNGLVPSDADSTAWGLLLATAVGDHHSARARAAERFLRLHRVPGGVATYRDEAALRAYLGSPAGGLDGWLGLAPCVSAAAANVPMWEGALDPDLLALQRDDGSWRTYWWSDPAHATHLAVRALRAAGGAGAARARAFRWAESRIESKEAETGDFDLACCLRLIAIAPPSEGRDRSARSARARLYERQQPDGGWASSAQLRVPARDDLTPDRSAFTTAPGDATGVVRLDLERVFTTATVLAALTEAEGIANNDGLHPQETSAWPTGR